MRSRPSHRHAAPSGPWPWIDVENEDLPSPPVNAPVTCDHNKCDECWRRYPQSLFPNWSEDQVKRSQLHAVITNDANVPCKIHHFDIEDNGHFTASGEITSTGENVKDTWDILVHSKRPGNVRLRALFIENLSGPVLQMLGTRYWINPSFFSSTLNWIPSRYQEGIQPGQGDHVTVTLTFLKSLPYSSDTGSNTPTSAGSEQIIDTQAPLYLRSNKRHLVLDRLAVHLVRRSDSDTIIFLPPNPESHTTSALYLKKRVHFAGQSIYWEQIFRESVDSTFLLLIFIWHALYAWDEALEHLYEHICWLEARVIKSSEISLLQELYIFRAHHMRHAALLEDLRKTVTFVLDSPNPAMDRLPENEVRFSQTLMRRECTSLLNEINRLEMSRHRHDNRLENAASLSFARVNILESRETQKLAEASQELTKAAVRDSTAMKQISYLTMAFLPATFAAAIFGMHIKEIAPGTTGSLLQYLLVAIPLTILTVWIMVAFQSKHFLGHDSHKTLKTSERILWPFTLARRMFEKKAQTVQAVESIDMPRRSSRQEMTG